MTLPAFGGGPEEPQHETVPALGAKLSVVQCIGHGAMGTVYEVRHNELGIRRAVKVLDRVATGSYETAVRRFRLEAKVAAELEHEHIVRVFDLDRTQDGRPYIVMELLEGMTLDQLAAQGVAGVADVVRWLEGPAHALAALHQRQVVHRDVKPANLFWCRTSGKVKLLDFGVCHFGGQAARITGHGEMVGTPAYMAPEQILDRDVTAAVDTYALGMVAFELICGALPFGAASLAELFSQIIFSEPQLPSALLGARVGCLDPVFARVLSKDPAMRHPSPVAFVEDLAGAVRLMSLQEAEPEQAAGSVEGAASPVGVGSASGLRGPSRDAAIAAEESISGAAGVGTGDGDVGFVGTTHGAGGAASTASAAWVATRTRRRRLWMAGLVALGSLAAVVGAWVWAQVSGSVSFGRAPRLQAVRIEGVDTDHAAYVRGAVRALWRSLTAVCAHRGDAAPDVWLRWRGDRWDARLEARTGGGAVERLVGQGPGFEQALEAVSWRWCFPDDVRVGNRRTALRKVLKAALLDGPVMARLHRLAQVPDFPEGARLQRYVRCRGAHRHRVCARELGPSGAWERKVVGAISVPESGTEGGSGAAETACGRFGTFWEHLGCIESAVEQGDGRLVAAYAFSALAADHGNGVLITRFPILVSATRDGRWHRWKLRIGMRYGAEHPLVAGPRFVAALLDGALPEALIWARRSVDKDRNTAVALLYQGWLREGIRALVRAAYPPSAGKWSEERRRIFADSVLSVLALDDPLVRGAWEQEVRRWGRPPAWMGRVLDVVAGGRDGCGAPWEDGGLQLAMHVVCGRFDAVQDAMYYHLDTARRPWALFWAAEAAWRQGRKRRASALWRSIVDEPGSVVMAPVAAVMALERLGTASWELGRSEQARAWFRRFVAVWSSVDVPLTSYVRAMRAVSEGTL